MFQTIAVTFDKIVIGPILNIIIAFYVLFTSIGLPGALGFSVIAITIAVRFLMHPFFQKQMNTARIMQEIKPQIDAIQKKYKKDPQTLQKEQLKLYQKAGINPASGCLFAIIQMPLILGLYQTISIFLTSKGGEASQIKEINNKLYFSALKVQSINPHFFIFNLALSPSQAGVWYYYIIPIITAGLQFWQSKVTMPIAPVADNSKVDDPKKDASKNGGDFQKAMNTQMKYFFPIMVGYFSYQLPLGLSIYWNVFSLFSIVAHYITQNKKK